MKPKAIHASEQSHLFFIPTSTGTARVRILIRGAVQGVGFRPFVFRLAKELDLKGWVRNSPQGVTIEAEGPALKLDSFLVRLHRDKPANSSIQSFQYSVLDPSALSEFTILESDDDTQKTGIVLPDIAVCPECLKEMFNPRDRRYLYPFINCTYCGPRYSIVHTLPYDRRNTSMCDFVMCPECQREYDDPQNRRFHAQPNACPRCGPQLELRDQEGKIVASRELAIRMTVQAIRTGKIVALKGVGGFQLIVDAHNEEAVRRLRDRKNREEKPLAVMFPDLEQIQAHCQSAVLENYLLISREAPIVLLEKKRTPGREKALAHSLSLNNPYLGVMLPSSALHHVLLRELGGPIVATSGNLSDEPICIDEKEAVERLQGLADVFLVHNRPIVRHVDDSVVRVMAGRPLMLRRARGYAPLPITLKSSGPTVLAVGGHLKNTVALSLENNVFISQHIGDLESSISYDAFKKTIDSLKMIYEPLIEKIACDLHPQYLSTQYAEYDKYPLVRVQHHHAHIVSCMAENDLDEEVLGICWDGTGYGTDKTVWGGEFLLSTLTDFKRVAYLRTFFLPGGEQAMKDPARSALGILGEIFGEKLETVKFLPSFKTLTETQFNILSKMLENNLNSPRTSSMGRLFDAVSSMAGLQQKISFEGQAAMSLEYAIQDVRTSERYNFEVVLQPGGIKSWVIDWEPMIRQIVEDLRRNVYQGLIAAKFHNTLVEMAISVAQNVGQKKIVLSGGCFQNKYLSEHLIARLQEEGFQPYWHQWVPPNDGGVALGQTVVALARS